jgi:hypothetical protein
MVVFGMKKDGIFAIRELFFSLNFLSKNIITMY